ncbi:MAG: helix-turn-helix domain-containing protein [Nitrospiraceae bacterium]
MTTQSGLLRVNEAAELLQVSRWTVYRWLADGRLEGTKLGKGTLRILKESVMGLIDGNRVVLTTQSDKKR